MLPGITLSFLPATGWTSDEMLSLRCTYVAVFPGPLILLNSLLSIIPIVVVAILYSKILVTALKNVTNINAAEKSVTNSVSEPKLRVYRGNTNLKKTASVGNTFMLCKNKNKLKRSASFDMKYQKSDSTDFRAKSSSFNDLICENHKTNSAILNIKPKEQTQYDSKFSIYTIESNSDANISNSVINVASQKKWGCRKKQKPKQPNKWRAITVVMLTSGSFIVTWLPFFIVVIFFVLCEDKLTNPQCYSYRSLMAGPLASLAFFNSILNPLIYAWWHRGFQKTVKMLFQKYRRRYCSKDLKLSTTTTTRSK